MKKYESEGKKFHNSESINLKGINNGSSYKLKIEENVKKEKYETPKNIKGRRGSRFDIFNNDNNKSKNNLLAIKREKENIIKKKFTTNFTNFLDKNRDKLKDKVKDRIKDKEKIKEKLKDKIKDKVKDIFKEKNYDNTKSKSKDMEKDKEEEKEEEKEKENDNTNNLKSSTRTKKEKKKNKKKEKKEKNKTKEKDNIKEKCGGKKFSAKNLKLFSIKPEKENKVDNIDRKDKSRTHICRIQNNNLSSTLTKKMNAFQSVNFSDRNHHHPEKNTIKHLIHY